ncbi:metal-dependent hydrolase, partial [Vibrio anguillarum]|nr:metal-dependent hydrolase [Vibrio anguillarum]
RGQQNQPAYVVEVAAYIAQLKSLSLKAIEEKT